MANPNFTFLPFTGYTVPVVPVYQDQTSLAISSNSSRQNFVITADVIIEGNDVGTLKCYPLNNAVQINPQKLAENYLTHTFNYSGVGACDNYESIKPINLVLGEQFSRAISFSSITQYSTSPFLQLNLNNTTPFIQIGDRCFITKDDSSVNPQYNTYGQVYAVGASWIALDIPYNAVSVTETGTVYEGSQLYDITSATIGGVTGVAIQTSNTHHFNNGDTIFVTMDGCSKGTIQMNTGTHGQITSLMIGSTQLLSAPVNFTTDIPTTISVLCDTINSNPTTPLYTSYQYANSHKLHLYSDRWSGAISNGYQISITTTGDISFSQTPTMFTQAGYDALGEGWNAQITGTYTAGLTASNHFFFNPAIVYNNEPGSQRGSLISMNNYVFTGVTTGATYWIMNNVNRYDYNNYASTITGFTSGLPNSKFLTNKPRTTFPLLALTAASAYNYYSINDIATADILINPETSDQLAYMFVQTYSGNNVDSGNYIISLSSFTDSFSSSTNWKRYSIGVGAWNLNQIPDSAIITSETPAPHSTMITDATKFYSVTFYSGNTLEDILEGRIMTEGLIFNRQCSPYTYYELIWLNKWGAFDYYPLVANNEETINVDRTSFEQKRESIINQNYFGALPINRGMTDFTVKSSKSIKLYTNWLTLAESAWIAEVFESPQVYLYNPSLGSPNDITALFPVNITSTSVTLPNERSRMKMFEIDVQVSNRRINQKN